MSIIKFKKNKNFNVFIQKDLSWKSLRFDKGTIFFKGEKDSVIKIFDLIKKCRYDLKKIKQLLLKYNNCSSAIFFNNKYCVCFTDFCRSYPIFFRKDLNNILISNSYKHLKKNKDFIDEESLSFIKLCGYSLGYNTLLKNIKIMKPGEILYSDNKNTKLEKYFEYHVTIKKNKLSKEKLKKKLSIIVDDIIKNIIKKSNNRPIWVPLSGGLDSRLILCKLHENGYKNLNCFSYGLKNNAESLIAKDIAKSLNIHWRFIEIKKNNYVSFYSSSEKKKFDDFSDNLQVVPNYQDFLVIKKMLNDKVLPQEAIIINGQSGDFNTGNHIPDSLIKKNNFKNFLESLKKKHFFLFKSDDNPYFNNIVDRFFTDYLKFNKVFKKNLTDLYEKWEYEERQIKYVVNGQKTYDFWGIDWFLPLWDSEFVKFWTSVDKRYRYKQNLYKEFLNDWNYKNLFRRKFTLNSHTGLLAFFIKLLSFSLKISSSREKIISYFDYFSRYGFYYQYVKFSKYLKLRGKIKNPTSIHLLTWMNQKEIFKNIREFKN